MKELSSQNYLRTLSLVGVTGNSKQINSIISNNPHLSTIIIKSSHINKTIDDVTVECMTNLIQLQTLVISTNSVITGKNFSKLDSIIMF